MRSENYLKSITKTRRYESTKQEPKSQVGSFIDTLRVFSLCGVRLENIPWFRDNCFFASLTINPISNRTGRNISGLVGWVWLDNEEEVMI